jgi:hypothetical protein
LAFITAYSAAASASASASVSSESSGTAVSVVLPAGSATTQDHDKDKIGDIFKAEEEHSQKGKLEMECSESGVNRN